MGSPRRALVILPNLDLGGMEIVVMNYFRNIDRSRLVFDFAVQGESGFFEEEAYALGARIFRVPARGSGFFKNIGGFRKIYKTEKYDTAIVCTEHAFSFIDMAVAWACGVKTRAAWSHFSDYQGRSRLKRRLHFFARPLLRLCANMRLACTEAAGRWLFGKKNCHIINNAVDLKKFAYNPQTRDKMREGLGLGHETFAIGIVGRLVPVKNHAFAIEVFDEFRKKNGDNARLLIIGDGELRGELQRTARNAIFTGAVDNVHEYYQALDALIVPSLHEGFSLTAIEAQTAGLPVLISDTIPPDAGISGLSRFLPLGCAEKWAAELFNIKNNERAAVDLSGSGFEITREAAKLQEILERGIK